MGKAARAGCIGVSVALLCGGGFVAYNVLHGLTGGSSPAGYDATRVSSTPPDRADAAKFAGAFLKTWAEGPEHYQGAASDTDSPQTALADLRGYHDGLKLTSLAFSGVTGAGADPESTGGARVTFTVTAKVAGGTWSYPGALDVVQDGNGQKAVRWGPTVLYPGLGADQTLSAGAIAASASDTKVLAADGKTVLTAAAYPSLADIVPTIARYAADHGGTKGGSGGRGVAIVGSDGALVRTLKVFTAPTAATAPTTIDARLQAAAEQAVLDPHVKGHPSSVVALDWRTGHILAIAYHGPNDDAINAIKAPGSTMKIITSAALFDHAGLNPGSLAPCLKTQQAAGGVFKNEADVPANPHATIQQAFAESCNTAFVKDGFDDLVHDGDASTLHEEAYTVFGLGSWSIGGGVATTDPSIPADPDGRDQAAQFIGQGKTTMTPLILASVAATVADTGFHQPIIVPGTRQAPAARQISATTAGYLRQMMRAVVAYGTAAPRLAGLPGVGAKTGTAEEGDHTNGWLTAYNGRIAVASLVEGGSSGVDSAGYVVRALLTTTP
jgi:hypothetical protein